LKKKIEIEHKKKIQGTTIQITGRKEKRKEKKRKT